MFTENDKPIKIVISPNTGEGDECTFESKIYLSTKDGKMQGWLGSILFTARPETLAKNFSGEKFHALWGQETCDQNYRYAIMRCSFESPDLALIHSKLELDKFFDDIDNLLEVILLTPTKMSVEVTSSSILIPSERLLN